MVENERARGLVSIVTPTLNAQAFIAATLASIAAQQAVKTEHIVVDGGSSDDTLAIVSALAPWARIVSAPGLNQSAAINAGFRESTGEFFTFLNADDVLLPGALASGVRALQAHPSASVAFGLAEHIDARGAVLGSYPVGEATLEALSAECTICQPATLMRSTAFEEFGLLDETLNFAMDYDFWLRVASDRNAFAFVPEVWAQSRMHPANKTLGQRERVYTEIFEVLNRRTGYVPFTWVHAYAGYRLDGRDQFFDGPSGSPMRTLLTLGIGLCKNTAKPRRFLAEYVRYLMQFHLRKRL